MILVSACLAGLATRYDGGSSEDSTVRALYLEGEALAVCPEMLGGMGVPRPKAAITGGDGADVLAGTARVVDENGSDVTDAFINGARAALKAALEHGITKAVLKDKSPSCGAGHIYSGDRLVEGMGVAAALLAGEGIAVTRHA